MWSVDCLKSLCLRFAEGNCSVLLANMGVVALYRFYGCILLKKLASIG